MAKFSHIFLLLILTSLFVGCAQEADSLLPEPLPASKTPIQWSVAPVAPVRPTAPMRALVTNDLMQQTCTPVANGTHESIGLWGQYTSSESSTPGIVVEFNAAPLTYAPKAEDTNPHNDWNYPGDVKYWEVRSVYDFRACFPQQLMTSLMTQMDATIFQGGPINTSVLQEDILVAATQVNTLTSDLVLPVRLNLQHIFAAIKFKVKAVYGFTPPNGEAVTSCWLQNQSSATDLFSPSGYLVHSGNVNPEIKWYPYEASTAPMYEWQHSGVSFTQENTLYTPNNGMKGSAYTNNDGWLLVVPQQVKAGSLRFYYTLKQAGSEVFSVEIPAITYEPGVQYTYMLEIKGSSADVVLTTAPWNYLESSYDVVM